MPLTRNQLLDTLRSPTTRFNIPTVSGDTVEGTVVAIGHNDESGLNFMVSMKTNEHLVLVPVVCLPDEMDS